MTTFRSLLVAAALLLLAASAFADDPNDWAVLNQQGVVLNNQNRQAEAVSPLKQALAACAQAGTQQLHCRSLVSSNLCLGLTKIDRVEEGLPYCIASLDELRQDPTPNGQLQLYRGNVYIADVLQKQHRDAQAEPRLAEAVAIGSTPGTTVPPDSVANTIFRLGLIHREQRQYAKAIDEMRRAAAMYATRPEQVVAVDSWLQQALTEFNRDDEAAAVAQQAVALARPLAATNPSALVTALATLIREESGTGHLAEAEAAMREMLALQQKTAKPDDILVGARQRDLAELVADSGKATEAVGLAKQALAQFQQYAPARIGDIAIIQGRLAYYQSLAADKKPGGADSPEKRATLVEATRLQHQVRARSGFSPESDAAMKRSATLAEGVLPRGSVRLGGLIDAAGIYFFNQERYADAEPWLTAAAAIYKTDLPVATAVYASALDMLGQIDKARGQRDRAEANYKEALALLDQNKMAGSDDGIRIMHDYATVVRDSSRYAEAEVLFRKALALRTDQYGPASQQVAIELNSIGLLDLDWGRFKAAEDVLGQARDILDKIPGPPAEINSFVLINLGSVARAEGRYDVAEDFNEQARAVRQTIFGKDSAQPTRSLAAIAEIKLIRGRIDEAERLDRQALAASEAGGDIERFPTIYALETLVHIQLRQRKTDDAIATAKKAVALDEKLINAEQRGLLGSLFTLSEALFAAGKYDESVATADRALAAARTKLPPEAQATLAGTLDRAADFRAAAGFPKEATELMEQAAVIRAKLFGEKSLAVADSSSHLVPYLLAQGRAVEADKAAKTALAIGQDTFGADNSKLVPYLGQVSRAAEALGRYQASEQALRRALRLQEAAVPGDSPVLLLTLTLLADNLAQQKRGAEAEPVAARGVAIAEKWYGKTSAEVIWPVEALSYAQAIQGKTDAAATVGKRGIDIARSVYGPNHPVTALALRTLAATTIKLPGSHREARDLMEQAVAIDHALPNPVNLLLADDLNDLAILEQLDGELEPARQHLEQAIGIFSKSGQPKSITLGVMFRNLAIVDAKLGRKADAEAAIKLYLDIFTSAGADGDHVEQSL